MHCQADAYAFGYCESSRVAGSETARPEKTSPTSPAMRPRNPARWLEAHLHRWGMDFGFGRSQT
ncbi:hypothetical protein [Gloeobacter morelensis]|uniref:Uncharacterized protein n=1 Tax=Gloeobacter morelensis MG652769 TaxID=2781736 RepID=A0ABY3PSR2_9CYAN|nr:hypothetical protein [Gloeobacter morelensis]UFP96773.1 hypothetical protein ISF26_11420 [Gloeobacter morelensis MG652769]